MEDWELTSFKISRVVTESKLRSPASLINYNGELAVSFSSYPEVELKSTSMYFRAPKDYIHNQIKSYGGKINYQVTYSGYELEGKLFKHFELSLIIIFSAHFEGHNSYGVNLKMFPKINVFCSPNFD